MSTIRVLYAANVIHRRNDDVRQELAFSLLVTGGPGEKTVEVHWAGEDRHWQVTPAAWQRMVAPHGEIWRARIERRAAREEDDALPGDIVFAVRARMGDRDFWDNNAGGNHEINADSGVRLLDDVTLLDPDFDPRLAPGQEFLPVTIAVRPPAPPRRMFIRWTTDRWRTVTDTPCFFRRKHWHVTRGSAARNPNRYGTEIWISQLGLAHAFRIEYAIGCETPLGTRWDNNFGRNYVAHRPRLKVLTLNLHCNQEENQDAKLTTIARVLCELDVDIACFQEVAEPWNNGAGDWSANTAHLIQARTGRPYHVHLDWSHLGFGRYRESCAILSRFPFSRTDSCQVSTGGDAFDIHTRKVVTGRVDVPYLGPVDVYSAHLSWWEAGFAGQFERLRQWAAERRNDGGAATLLCGDFNVPASSAGYALATGPAGFVDQCVAGDLRARGDGDGTASAINDHGRIDYVLLHRDAPFEAVKSRRLFTDEAFGRVSDHPGYYVEFEPR